MYSAMEVRALLIICPPGDGWRGGGAMMSKLNVFMYLILMTKNSVNYMNLSKMCPV